MVDQKNGVEKAYIEVANDSNLRVKEINSRSSIPKHCGWCGGGPVIMDVVMI